MNKNNKKTIIGKRRDNLRYNNKNHLINNNYDIGKEQKQFSRLVLVQTTTTISSSLKKDDDDDIDTNNNNNNNNNNKDSYWSEELMDDNRIPYKNTTITTSTPSSFMNTKSSLAAGGGGGGGEDVRRISSSTTTSGISSSSSSSTFRTVRKMEKFARLPVWPVLNGVFLFFIGKLFGQPISSKIEHIITGRVCPNFYNYNMDTNPFIMLVHHCHSFHTFDPIRYIQRSLILPEGFPAHPHRGFITITYILHGGFIHRDSMGIKQLYGDALSNESSSSSRSSVSSSNSMSLTDNSKNNKYNGKHTQWLYTGSGLLHEEMFDIQHNNNILKSNRQELYQIWLNVPASEKMKAPQTILLGGQDETPTIISSDGSCSTTILAGSYDDDDDGRIYNSAAPIVSDIAIFHVQIKKADGIWKYTIPSNYRTAFLYIRHGTSIRVLQSHDDIDNKNSNQNTIKNNSEGNANNNIIPVHHTAYFTASGNEIWLQSMTTSSGGREDGDVFCDFLFLAGEPINEPCVAQGSMVMNTPEEINRAYYDYQNGLFGIPWDYKLSDIEWKKHISSSPSSKRQ